MENRFEVVSRQRISIPDNMKFNGEPYANGGRRNCYPFYTNKGVISLDKTGQLWRINGDGR